MKNNKSWALLARSVQRQTDQLNKPVKTYRNSGRKIKDKTPEKKVESDCREWAKKNNIFFHVVESKAVFSEQANRYMSGQAESGFPDLCGNDNQGQSLWVELKAHGKRSNLSAGQYFFLKSKIEQGCFSVVVDSSSLLNEYYYTWLSSKNRSSYLSSLLPYPSCLKKQDKGFDSDFGF